MKSLSEESALSQFCVDLTARASEGRIDPVVGREVEVQRIIQILCRKTKSNPILLGEAGVGKTAIAEGLALRIAKADVSPFLLVCFSTIDWCFSTFSFLICPCYCVCALCIVILVSDLYFCRQSV